MYSRNPLFTSQNMERKQNILEAQKLETQFLFLLSAWGRKVGRSWGRKGKRKGGGVLQGGSTPRDII